MPRLLLCALAALLIAVPAAAESMTFDFKDPKGVNAIGFFVDSELEPIMGVGSGVSGTITYDPEDPSSFAGSISLSAENLNASNPRMTEVMQGADWLGIAEHAKVTFTFNNVSEVTMNEDGKAQLKVDGELSLVGMTKPMSVMIQADHIPDGAAKRGGAKEGDLLVLRSMFRVNRTDFGIKEDMGGDKVGEEIGIVVAIVGYSK